MDEADRILNLDFEKEVCRNETVRITYILNCSGLNQCHFTTSWNYLLGTIFSLKADISCVK